MRVFLARHLYPVAVPPVVDGAVAVDGGRITLAGPRDSVLEAVPAGSEVRDLGESAILPGLINAHTHIELSWLGACRPEGGDFVRWVRGLLDATEAEDEHEARRSAELGLEQMIERGTVAVGDIANRSWAGTLVAKSGLHGVLFQEVFRFRSEDAQRTRSAATGARDDLERSLHGVESRLRAAVAAHATHTSSAALLRALSHVGEDRRDPLALHLAESPDESRFLRDGSGPFRELFQERGVWDSSWQPPGVSPVQYADRLGLLSPRTLAVHCVQLEAQDHGILQTRGATVVTCPRSNAYLGVGTAPVHALLTEGISVALGTDSLASAPDLDLFGEMAAALRDHPQLSPAAVLRMATLNGACALRVDDRLGSIERGKLAELVVLPLTSETDDPLEHLRDVPERVHRIDRAPWEQR